MTRLLVITGISLLLIPILTGLSISEPVHGFSVLGDVKYPKNFPYFEYVEPGAQKGGQIHLWRQGNYDSLNPFILKGHKAAGSDMFGSDGRLITFETLMVPSLDEPDTYYGLVAKSIKLGEGRRSVTFNMRESARFHDGSAITADDVVYTFGILKSEGHPIFKIRLQDVSRVEKLSPHAVKFEFRFGADTRDLPATVASLPILSKAYYFSRNFNKTTLEAPLGSGPYIVDNVNAGRSISYKRVKNHWASSLNVYQGRWNFDKITWLYFRDRDIALEALFAGRIDFREDFTSRNWATKYKRVPSVKEGRLIKEVLPDETPSGFQAFFLNTRRSKFSDPRVRQALGKVFDFEWTNRNLFHGMYKRTYSIFQNSDMEAVGVPLKDELKLLNPLRKVLPKAVFGPAKRPTRTDGTGNIRGQLRQARRLLRDAGWVVLGGKLVDPQGNFFEIEFLSFGKAFERVIMPYIRNLEKLGIVARFRLVEPAQYQKRIQSFDFDITTFRLSSPLTPGTGLRDLWGSNSADVIGSRNYTGLKNNAVDKLIEKIVAARSRSELLTAARTLDRVIMWTHSVVPQWNKASHNIAYWNIFGRPNIKPKYALGMLDTWWVDPEKLAKLNR